MAEYIYVSLQGEDEILVFAHERAILDRRPPVPIHGGPGPLGVSPDRRWIYAGLRDEPGLAALRIEPDGGLTEIGRVPLEADPCHVSTDRTGRYLFAAYFAEGMITVHALDESGVPESRPRESRRTARTAHMMMADASNRFVLVPHRDSDVILQFVFDSQEGRLVPNRPDRVSMAEGAGPRHFCHHPAGPWLYVSNELDSTVTACRFDRETGVAEPVQTLSTLPEGYTGDNSCSQIHITPDARWLYLSNRGHDSLAGFGVDPETGLLERGTITPTEPIPRAFNIDTAGRTVFAAGRDSGQLAVYGLDGASGSLSRIGSYSTGRKAMWVLPVCPAV